MTSQQPSVQAEHGAVAPAAPSGTLRRGFAAAVAARARRARFRSRHLRRPVVALRHRGLQPEDAFVVSYPRSGSTWVRFLLCEALSGERAAFGELHHVLPYVGSHTDAVPILPRGGRLVHSHETHHIGDRPVLYVVRDPRDVVLSEYRWQRSIGVFDGSFEPFLDDFLDGRSNPWGSWGDHVLRWLSPDQLGQGPVAVVRYETLRLTTARELIRMLEFFGARWTSDGVVEVVEANSLDAMQQKERQAPAAFSRVRWADIPFVGTGSIGGWRTRLAREQVSRVEDRFGDAMALAGYALAPAPATAE